MPKYQILPYLRNLVKMIGGESNKKKIKTIPGS